MTYDEALVAALFAVNPSGLGGVALRSPAGSERDEWLVLLKELLPAQTPIRRVPLNIQDSALLGGLDLAATLQSGRPVSQQGVLAQADGGIIVLSMAERISTGMAARLSAVLENQEVVMERDGIAFRKPVRLGMVALDEGLADDEQMPASLLDRMAFQLVMVSAAALPQSDEAPNCTPEEILQARILLPQVKADDEVIRALCATAMALGVASMRAPVLALRVAKTAAALAGLDTVEEIHVSLAARLVLAPRATQIPAPPPDDEVNEPQPQEQQPEQPPQPAEPPEAQQESEPDTPPEPQEDDDPPPLSDQELAEIVLEAAKAAIPPGLLAALKLGQETKSRAQTAGRAGAAGKSQTRGRPIGARRGELRAGARLNVIETLRAAAPWQKLRALQFVSSLPMQSGQDSTRKRIYVRREDFHVTRFKQVGQTTTVFLVDASGSSALNRLAEAKGAVELLLADCYVRRDRVSVLSFRGKSAELLLPPTRSLARAKRSLAGLPGGGGTPLASGLDAAREMADQIRRRGETPIIVVLTDGRGNVSRDGSPGRVKATEDALLAATQIRQSSFTILLIDTSAQLQPSAQSLAKAMGATYLALPYAGAQIVSQAVRLATASGNAGR